MRIHHIATAADWRAARRSGAYTTSTLGRTLEQEGFVHFSRPEQVRGTWQRFYADAGEPLVLLTVDTDRLDRLGVAWREDEVGDDTFPHVYGAVPRDAVVAALPLDAAGRPPSLLGLFLREAVPLVVAAVVVMLVAGTGATVAGEVLGEGSRLPTAVVLLVVGALVTRPALRRLRP